MLSPRYENDGRPILKLNRLQREMKGEVERKVADGTYAFEKVPCPVCGGDDFDPLAEKDRYGLYLPVVICRDCGLIQTNPRMDQHAYNAFYNDEYRRLYVGSPHPTDVFFRRQYDKGRRIFDYLGTRGLLEGGREMRVLEVGCGAGGILHYFRKQGFLVEGLDLGESYIEYGRSRYQLNLSVGTVHDLDPSRLEDAPDLIIYSHVLEHILHPNDELQRIRGLASDDTLLYIEVPGVKNLMRSYDMDFLRMLQNAHVYHFTLRSLVNLLARNGFGLIDGNESINSVFSIAPDGQLPEAPENDIADAMAYLTNVERLRRIYPVPPYKLHPKLMAASVLKSLGLFDSAQSLYLKLTGKESPDDSLTAPSTASRM